MYVHTNVHTASYFSHNLNGYHSNIMRKRQYVTQLFPSIRVIDEKKKRKTGELRAEKTCQSLIVNEAKLVPCDIKMFKLRKAQ